MQPLIVAEETRRGIADFHKTTFPATTPDFESVVSRFVDEPGNLVKGSMMPLRSDKALTASINIVLHGSPDRRERGLRGCTRTLSLRSSTAVR